MRFVFFVQLKLRKRTFERFVQECFWSLNFLVQKRTYSTIRKFSYLRNNLFLSILYAIYRDQKHTYQTEIHSLNAQLSQLISEQNTLSESQQESRSDFESNQSRILSDIENITVEISSLKSSLERLIDRDNQLTELILKLELEIKAYEAMLDIERKNNI